MISSYLFDMWVRDSIREYTSIHLVLIEIFVMAFCVLILTESLFFVTFFWSLFYTSCSSIWFQEGMYLSDSINLTFVNTVLLSNSGLCLG